MEPDHDLESVRHDEQPPPFFVHTTMSEREESVRKLTRLGATLLAGHQQDQAARARGPTDVTALLQSRLSRFRDGLADLSPAPWVPIYLTPCLRSTSFQTIGAAWADDEGGGRDLPTEQELPVEGEGGRDDEDRAKRATATAALAVLQSVHAALTAPVRPSSTSVSTTEEPQPEGGRAASSREPIPPPTDLLFTDDLATLDTLAGVAVRWGLQPRINAFDCAVSRTVRDAATAAAAAEGEEKEEAEAEAEEKVTEAWKDLAEYFSRFRTLLGLRRRLSDTGERRTGGAETPSPTSPSSIPSSLALTSPLPAILRDAHSADVVAALVRLVFWRPARGRKVKHVGPSSSSSPSPAEQEGFENKRKTAGSELKSVLKTLPAPEAFRALSFLLRPSSSRTEGTTASPPQATSLPPSGIFSLEDEESRPRTSPSSSSSSTTPTPAFVRTAALRLLTAQLLRPDGVAGLVESVLGGGPGESGGARDEQGIATSDTGVGASAAKLDHIARLLGTPPKEMEKAEYFSTILPRILALIDPPPPAAPTLPVTPHIHRIAAVYALSYIVERHGPLVRRVLWDIVWGPFEPVVDRSVRLAARRASRAAEDQHGSESDADDVLVVTPHLVQRAVRLLRSILIYASPGMGPPLLSYFVRPILPQLFSLYEYLDLTPEDDGGGGRKHAKRRVLIVEQVEPPTGGAGTATEPKPTGRLKLKEDVRELLRTYTRLSSRTDAEGAWFDVVVRLGLRPTEGGPGIGESEWGRRVGEEMDKEMGVLGEAPHEADHDHDWGLYWTDIDGDVGVCYGRATPRTPASAQDLLNLLSPLATSGSAFEEPPLSDISNIPDLRGFLPLSSPDPPVFAAVLKESQREDVSGGVFIRLLEEYQTTAQAMTEDRNLLILQLVLQLLAIVGPSAIADEPEKVLSFVNFVLDRHVSGTELQRSSRLGQLISEVEPTEIALSSSADAGIATAGVERLGASASFGDEEAASGEEMVRTALSLLLSVLEGRPELSTSSLPLLAVVSSKLPALSSSPTFSTDVRQLAREASLVLTSRSAAEAAPGSGGGRGSEGDDESRKRERAMVIYREALRLLQDPIIPVRAHGIHLLRALLARPPPPARLSPSEIGPTSFGQPARRPPARRPGGRRAEEEDERPLLASEPALSPSLLDLFIKTIADDESYLYLNAIKGLADMGDLSGEEGKKVVRELVRIYTGRRDNGATGFSDPLERAEVDKRLRVGEALAEVIKRNEESLSVYTPLLIPPLMAVVRQSTLPVVLRSSALTLLATCLEASPVAVSRYVDELVDVCITLLVVEGVTRPVRRGRSKDAEGPRGEKPESTGYQASRGTTSNTASEKASDAGRSEARAAEEAKEDLLSELTPAEVERLRVAEAEEEAPTTTSAKRQPTLRRGALLFLTVLLRAAKELLEGTGERGGELGLGGLRLPGGRFLPLDPERRTSTTEGGAGRERRMILFPLDRVERTKELMGYLEAMDEDGVVRVQAAEVRRELEEWHLVVLHAGLSL